LASAHGGFTEIGVRKKPTSVSLSLLDFCCWKIYWGTFSLWDCLIYCFVYFTMLS
jgi:hypothetical protein